MNPIEELESRWMIVEANYRKALEEYLIEAKAAFIEEFLPKRRRVLPIFPLKLVYYDINYNLPLVIFQYDVFGTREELLRIIERHHNELIDSAGYRKSQNAAFIRLKKQSGLKDKEILDLLIPDASKDERARVYNRLKQDSRRKKKARQATKS